MREGTCPYTSALMQRSSLKWPLVGALTSIFPMLVVADSTGQAQSLQPGHRGGQQSGSGRHRQSATRARADRGETPHPPVASPSLSSESAQPAVPGGRPHCRHRPATGWCPSRVANVDSRGAILWPASAPCFAAAAALGCSCGLYLFERPLLGISRTVQPPHGSPPPTLCESHM